MSEREELTTFRGRWRAWLAQRRYRRMLEALQRELGRLDASIEAMTPAEFEAWFSRRCWTTAHAVKKAGVSLSEIAENLNAALRAYADMNALPEEDARPPSDS